MSISEIENKITCADCLEVLKQIPDKSVDVILTDPPYKQEFHGRGMSKDRPNYLRIKDYGSSQDMDYTEFFNLAISKMKKINFFTFCDKETKFEFITLAKAMGLGWHEVSFCKTSPTPFTNNQWLPDIEWGLHIFKDLEVMGDYGTKKSFFIMQNFKEADINHPTPKRIDVVEKILLNISKEGDLVLDCFSGSGTTAIACHRLKRRFICIEKDPEYWAASVKRLEEEQSQGVLF
jgi:DNA modification methylase